MGTSTFSGTRFVELLRYSAQEAFEYRLKTLGELIPDEYGPAKLDTSMNSIDFSVKIEEPVIEDITDPAILENDNNTIIATLENEVETPVTDTTIQTPPETLETDAVLNGSDEVLPETTPVTDEVKTEITRDEVKALLTTANIEFTFNAPTEKLIQLCIENKLL